MTKRLGAVDLDLLEQLFGQLPDAPFFVKDSRLHYVAANMAMARLCGVDHPKDLYGKRVASFFPLNLARRYEMLDAQVLTSGRAITNQLELTKSANAKPAWLLFCRIPVRDPKGAIVGIAATSRQLRQPEGSEPAYRRLADALDRLRKNWDQPLRLGELARSVGISKSQIERDFKRLFGVTPRGFLQQTRMDEALRFLETDTNIAAIAYDCGYADHSAFTRRFRQVVGISPSEYRRRLQAPKN